jgi:hypothetical protein
VHETVKGGLILDPTNEFIECGDAAFNRFAWREGLPFPNGTVPTLFRDMKLSGAGAAFSFLDQANQVAVAKWNGTTTNCLASTNLPLHGFPGLSVQQVMEFLGTSQEGRALFGAAITSPTVGGSITALLEASTSNQVSIVGLLGQQAPGLPPDAYVTQFLAAGYAGGDAFVHVTMPQILPVIGRTALYAGTLPFANLQLLLDSNEPASWRPDQAVGEIGSWSAQPGAVAIAQINFPALSASDLVLLSPGASPVVVVSTGDNVGGFTLTRIVLENNPSPEGGTGASCMSYLMNPKTILFGAQVEDGAGPIWALVLATP